MRIDASQAVLTALEGVSDGAKKRDIVLSLGARYTARALAGMGPSLLLAGAACLNEQRGAMVAQALKAREVLAPLAGLTRVEAARLGVVLGMPRSLALSQPFPEDGLVRRMDGTVTRERLELLRHADGLFRAEVERSRARPTRYFAALTADDSVLLRVLDVNGAPAGLSWRTAAAAALRIQAECGVDRVSYDLTPAIQPEQNWF